MSELKCAGEANTIHMLQKLYSEKLLNLQCTAEVPHIPSMPV